MTVSRLPRSPRQQAGFTLLEWFFVAISLAVVALALVAHTLQALHPPLFSGLRLGAPEDIIRERHPGVVAAACAGDTQPKCKSRTLTLPRYEVAGQIFRVTFTVDAQDGLQNVVLVSDRAPESDGSITGNAETVDLASALTMAHGAPLRTSRPSADGGLTTTWRRRGVLVQLTERPSARDGQFVIRYSSELDSDIGDAARRL